MKKIWLVLLALMILVGFSFASAQAATPKGLKNKPLLEKRVFIHYKKGHAKPPWAGGGDKAPKEPKCYDFLSKGAKLKATVDLTIHPNVDFSAIHDSALTWDHQALADLFGSYTKDPTATWDSDIPDGRNEFVLGDYPSPGVIAVTIAWGYFSGPPPYREILEFDVLFDTDFVWGNAKSDSSVMDWQNIATHEIGHGLGLGDIYNSACSEVTMYGYSTEGETKKRTLEPADINGLQELYGN